MKRNNSVWLVIVAVAVLTIVPAVLHGRYVSRWGKPAEQEIAAQALDDFPSQLGEWVVVADGEPLPARVERELGLKGYVSRVYRNPNSGKEVAMLLMVGEAGPLVRHPPEICYGSRENELLSSKEVKVPSNKGNESEFRLLSYSSKSQLVPPFTVAYAWTSNGVWSVPTWPRVAYGGEPVLYKVQFQLVHSALEGAEPEEELQELLEAFVAAFGGFVRSADAGTGD